MLYFVLNLHSTHHNDSYCVLYFGISSVCNVLDINILESLLEMHIQWAVKRNGT
jgi:hypothetical protein